MNFLKLLIIFFLLFCFAGKVVCQLQLNNKQFVNAAAISNNLNCLQLPADFKIDFNVCNQFQIDFSNNSLDATVIAWNFGDGNSANGGENTSHVYGAEGVYKAMLIVQNNTGCTDTIYKSFLLNIDKGKIFTNKRLDVCKGIAFRMPGDSTAVENCWSPALYLDSPSIYNPLCAPLNNIDYKYNIIVRDRDIIPNGEFTAGNNLFSSDYTYSGTVNTSGHYFVGPKPKQWNPLYQNCNIVNAPNDSMLIVNGSVKPNLAVWETTIPVTPKTNYLFGFFAEPLTKTDSLVLDISLNAGEVVGRMRVSKNICNRRRFSTSWYSGNNNSINIKITDLDTGRVNNNFALDTIILRPVYLKTDSIHVRLIPQPVFKVTPATATICPGDSVLLKASGGDIYTWSPQASLSMPFSASTYAEPASATTYKVVITENTCNVTDSVFTTVNLSQVPTISITKSNDIDCANIQSMLIATGGVSYHWKPSNTLSNADIANPIATPHDTTVYHVKVANAIGCSSEDSIQLLVLKDKTFGGYLVPGAFTPNNDGLNDCFGIRKWGNVADLEFSVYNRWGQVVFATKDFARCWDGSYKGIAQPAGTYIYMIKGNALCGKVTRKGTVVLIR